MRQDFSHKELHSLVTTNWLLRLLLDPIGVSCVIYYPRFQDDCVIPELGVEKGIAYFLHLIFLFHSLDVSCSHATHQLLPLISVETHENRIGWLVCNLCRKHVGRQAAIITFVTALTSEQVLILLLNFFPTVFFWARKIKDFVIISDIRSVTIHLILCAQKSASSICGSPGIYRLNHLTNQAVLIIIRWTTVTCEIVSLCFSINVFNLIIWGASVPIHEFLCPFSFRIYLKVCIIPQIHLLPIVINYTASLHSHYMSTRL